MSLVSPGVFVFNCHPFHIPRVQCERCLRSGRCGLCSLLLLFIHLEIDQYNVGNDTTRNSACMFPWHLALMDCLFRSTIYTTYFWNSRTFRNNWHEQKYFSNRRISHNLLFEKEILLSMWVWYRQVFLFSTAIHFTYPVFSVKVAFAVADAASAASFFFLST